MSVAALTVAPFAQHHDLLPLVERWFVAQWPKLQPVERAMGLMAGNGLQLWPILQDIHQLRSLSRH